MRNIAIEYPERSKTQLVDIGPPPDPKPSEILIETQFSGLTNGTERHALLGEHLWDSMFPSRHGYQHVGRVRAIGSQVDQVHVDDHVFVGRYVGHHGWLLQDVEPCTPIAAALPQSIVLPEGIDFKDCALLGVAGVALRGIRRFRVAPGDRVWIVGLGVIGQFAAQAARAFGAHVTVSDVDSERLAIAKESGAHTIMNARDADYWERLQEIGPFDRVIDCSGVDSLLQGIFKHGLLKHRSVVGLLAVRSETQFHWSMLHTLEASIEVSCHFDHSDLQLLIHFLRTGLLNVKPIISHFVPIEDAVSAYETLRDNPNELLGVVFDWTG